MLHIDHGAQLRVQEGDALTHPADVLVLKWAQMPYGVDAQAIRRAGIQEESLPRPGATQLMRAPKGMAANALLFVGVPELAAFGYAEIREFARRGLGAAATQVPGAEHIAFTMHGAGYGLDEIEAFQSEVGGVLAAIANRDVPPDLRTVTFVERDRGRAQRMSATLNELLFKVASPASGAHAGTVLPRSAAHLNKARSSSPTRKHAFVAMPFKESFADRFHYAIAPAVRRSGLVCERIDEKHFTGDILARMKRLIREARLVVADLSDANPNVYLEVGYAWALEKPTVLVCHKDSKLRFDVQGQRCLLYTNIRELEEALQEELEGLLAAD